MFRIGDLVRQLTTAPNAFCVVDEMDYTGMWVREADTGLDRFLPTRRYDELYRVFVTFAGVVAS